MLTAMQNNGHGTQKAFITAEKKPNITHGTLCAALFPFIVIKLSLDKVNPLAYNSLKYRKGDGSYASHRAKRQHDDGYDDAHGYHGHDDACAENRLAFLQIHLIFH